MLQYIALYRGINVSGRNAVKMEQLRGLHERLGHQNVKSYIQSGNMVVSTKGSSAAIARKLAAEFEKEFGFAARVVVVDAARWGQVVAQNPYAKFAAKKPQAVHAAICAGPPNSAALKALLAKTGGSEQFAVRGESIYLHTPDGFGVSKFAAGMERASGVAMTFRNWRTVEALWAMVKTKA